MLNKEFIKNLPEKKGVYLFQDKNGNILYVGKAINLKKRVKNYFDKKNKEKRIINLLKESEKISYFTVDSEMESLLLEAKLIKQNQPKYNIRLKDDKRFLSVGITKEEYPRIMLIRQPEKANNLYDWFGPFASSQSLKEILRLIRRVFPYRTCKKLPKSVCLYYYLNLCPGICQFPFSKRKYLEDIKKIRLFLNGEISFLLKKLNLEMSKFAQKMNFEEAEKRKKQIQMIENLLGKFKRIPEQEEIFQKLQCLRKIIVKYQKIDPIIIHRLEAYDVANLGKNIVVGSMAVFIDGEPDVSEYRQFKVKTKTGDPQALREIISRRLNHPEWLYPQIILVDGGKPQISATLLGLERKKLLRDIAILGLAKKEEKIIIPVFHNRLKRWAFIKNSPALSILQFARDEAHRFAQRYYKRILKKQFLPLLSQNKNRGAKKF